MSIPGPLACFVMCWLMPGIIVFVVGYLAYEQMEMDREWNRNTKGDKTP